MEFKCDLCGYIILEEDMCDDFFRCPVCGVDKYHFVLHKKVVVDKKVFISDDNLSINRVQAKCINCGVCSRVCKNSNGLVISNECDNCINCGKCIMNCPTGALTPKYNYREVFDIIHDRKKIVVAFTAPAVRVGLSECFGLPFGTNVEGKMVDSLRCLGFDYVFDTSFGADVTIMEEANELIERIKNNGVFPMFSSCCPSWVKYLNFKYPEMIQNLSTTKSPNAIMGVLIKNYFSNIIKVKPQDIVTVGIVPCTSKKYEASRDDLITNGLRDLDYMLTTTELSIMIKESNIDFLNLKDSKFDSIMGNGSGAGYIFGNSGGVTEALIRTLKFMLDKEDFEENDISLNCLRGDTEFRDATFNFGGLDIKVAIVYGIENVEALLKKIQNKEVFYHFVEVMTCENGCIGGSGQALLGINKLHEARDLRKNNLYKLDKIKNVRCAHHNKEVEKIYNEFKGNLLEILHTDYNVKEEIKVK